MRLLGSSALCVVLSRGDGSAIKIPSPKGLEKLGSLAAFDARFDRELRTASYVAGHPGVISPTDVVYMKIKDLGTGVSFPEEYQEASIPALVMAEGGPDLIAAATQRKPHTKEILSWVLGIAEAVEHCHTQGVVHRDLKLTNVVLCGEKPRLIDFGAAIHADEALSAFGQSILVGTPPYLPDVAAELPPLKINRPPGTDTYALGVLARALLSRKNPKTELSRAISFVPEHLRSVILSASSFGHFERPTDFAYALVDAHATSS